MKRGWNWIRGRINNTNLVERENLVGKNKNIKANRVKLQIAKSWL